MARHEPTFARDILRSLRQGVPAKALVPQALDIAEPGQRAQVLAKLAANGAPCRRQAITSAELVNRLSSKAEVWKTVLKQVPHPETRDAAVQDIVAMAPGKWSVDAITAVAPHVGRLRAKLLEYAVDLPGDAVPACKAVIRHMEDEELSAARAIISNSNDEVRARLLGSLPAAIADAVAAAWSVEEDAKRREALRVLIWQHEGEQLRKIRRSAEGKPAADGVHVLLVTAARADRLGMEQASRWLDEAVAATKGLPDGPDKVKLLRKAQMAVEKREGDVAAAQALQAEAQSVAETVAANPEPEPVEEAEPQLKLRAAFQSKEVLKRHVLALVDAYQGGLSKAHLQAIGRAAPLCKAFNLDLLLVGFPTKNAKELVEIVANESGIGEGQDYAGELLAANRLRLHPIDDPLPGKVVATTPHPHKPGKLEGGPICLLVGLGRQGLPKRYLEEASAHYELTGKGISFETATAMGILADRLGRVPFQLKP